MRRAKIVCTIGPASSSEEAIEALIREGMECARLNFSHASGEQAVEVADRVRSISRQVGRPVAILQDLPGPKMRVRSMPEPAVVLKAGKELVLTTEAVAGTAERAAVTYEGLPRDVQAGDRLLLDDGLLELEVLETDGRKEVRAKVIVGGPLGSHKGINLPGVRISAPSFTARDAEHLAVGISIPVDLVAVSFVRGPDDVLGVREILEREGASDTQVIAKIEKPEAVTNLEAIVEAFDGIMVARGDLGVELGPHKVPLVQKRAIDATNRRGKLVIVATQMLDSMIRNPRPTRAEASDVANAVLDNADALMLSGETAVGRYPVETVRMMGSIICEVEGSARFWSRPPESLPIDTVRNAIARAAVAASQELPLAAIAVVTMEGRTARLLSEYRPSCPVVAVTPSEKCARQLSVYWGVVPVLCNLRDRTKEMIAEAARAVAGTGIAGPGDTIAITLAIPPGTPDGTNVLHLHHL